MKLALCFCCLLIAGVNIAQQSLPYNYAKCNTRIADSGYYMKNAQAFLSKTLAERKNTTSRINFNAPFVVRTFIRIVRENDGTLPGCSVATAIQNFNEMNIQYNAHNICFQLVGIDFINDSYLNNFNDDSKLDNAYPAYIRNNDLDVDGAITIFIHYNFLNNNGSSGNAYGIPNNFLSIARWAVEATDVHSIFGHEMGHCLGLYHTFETNADADQSNIQESVTRNSASSCYNCTTQGDLCCDTPADYGGSQSYTNSNTCVYNRNFVNSCDNLQYSPSRINIMSYQPWTCISTTGTALTGDQQTRMQSAILDPNGPIYARIAEDNLILLSLYASNTSVKIYSARNNVTNGNGALITQTSGSKAYYTAGNSIIFNPGVTFSPGNSGVVNAAIAGCN